MTWSWSTRSWQTSSGQTSSWQTCHGLDKDGIDLIFKKTYSQSWIDSQSCLGMKKKKNAQKSRENVEGNKKVLT